MPSRERYNFGVQVDLPTKSILGKVKKQAKRVDRIGNALLKQINKRKVAEKEQAFLKVELKDLETKINTDSIRYSTLTKQLREVTDELVEQKNVAQAAEERSMILEKKLNEITDEGKRVENQTAVNQELALSNRKSSWLKRTFERIKGCRKNSKTK